MPVYLYLKSASRITLSSIFRSFHKLVFLGGILSFLSTLLRLPHLILNRNLYLNLSAPGKHSSQTPKFLQWLRGKGKMTPTISICGKAGGDKERKDLALKELPKLPIASDNGGFSIKKFAPLLVAFVGIPARGKTVTAHKLARYLSWTGETVKVFTVNEYRRKLVEQYDSHDLLRADNGEALEICRKCSLTAMEDAAQWLRGGGHVAVLDGTNETKAQREVVYEYFVTQLRYKLLYVESIVDDDEILSRNVKEILQNSPDYKDMAEQKALNDFQQKIQHYLEKYEPMDAKQESNLRYIKVINEGESVSTYHLSGQLESRILGFLSNFKPGLKTLYFSRHGESENNVLGRIGGDTNLSPRGWKYAHSLACYINETKIKGLRVWTSELCRTKQTAEGIEASVEHVSALNELDAGVCEGMTYEEMQDKFPQEFAWRDQDKLHYRYPWGESYVDIMNRLNPVLLELEHENNLLVVSHQAVLRCILGYFLNKKSEELPYINVPLHTLIKITVQGYTCHMELTKLNVECVDTYRKQPENCSTNRTAADALVTVPSHFDNLNFWHLSGHPSLITQH